MRLKAMVISAFCSIMLIDLNIPKMRFLQFPHTPEPDLHITLYDRNWLPTHVPPQPCSEARFLGTHFDDTSSSSTDLSLTLSHLTSCAHAIRSSNATAAMKITTIRVSVLPSIQYSLRHSSLLPSQLQSHDSTLRSLYKSTLQHMHSFPSRLIHAPRTLGGLGLPSATETIFLDKWGLALRGLFSPDPLTQSVTHSVLEQSLTNSTLNHAHQMQLTIPTPPTSGRSRTPLFTDILLLYAAHHQLRLTRSGTKPTDRELPLDPTTSLTHFHSPSHLFPFPRIGYLQSITDPPHQWSFRSLHHSISISPHLPPPLLPSPLSIERSQAQNMRCAYACTCYRNNDNR